MADRILGAEVADKIRNPKWGMAGVVRELQEGFETGRLHISQLSLRDLWRNLVPEGRSLLERMENRKSGGLTLLEAGNAVDTTAFSNTTGQIIYNAVIQAFNQQPMLWKDCCETMQTQFLDGERVAGIGQVGDKFEIVDQGMPYPTVGLNEEYVDAPPPTKRGAIIPVTREMVIADRTGLLMQRCNGLGEWLAWNKEKRVLDVVFGVTNNYKRLGTASNTYLTSGAYINQQANPLVDWRSLNAAYLLFDAITDPNTGEPILIQPDTIIVPSALLMDANRILHATQVRVGDGNSASTATYSDNPAGKGWYGGPQPKVLASAYVKSRTSSASTWFLGSPKKSFKYSEVWGIETTQAPANSFYEFDRDIQYQFRVSEMGVAWAYEPRYMTKNT